MPQMMLAAKHRTKLSQHVGNHLRTVRLLLRTWRHHLDIRSAQAGAARKAVQDLGTEIAGPQQRVEMLAAVALG